jgi:hypothetical protein
VGYPVGERVVVGDSVREPVIDESAGNFVGDTVGSAMGTAVGSAVGLALGLMEGAADGEVDGAAIGAPVGAALDSSVGVTVGNFDGAAVGADIGVAVGAADGAFVGRAVGTAVGAVGRNGPRKQGGEEGRNGGSTEEKNDIHIHLCVCVLYAIHVYYSYGTNIRGNSVGADVGDVVDTDVGTEVTEFRYNGSTGIIYYEVNSRVKSNHTFMRCISKMKGLNDEAFNGGNKGKNTHKQT